MLYSKGNGKKLRMLGALLLICCWIVCAVPSAAAAYQVPAPTAQFYVNDFAGLLAADTKEYVDSVNEQLYAKCGAQVVITTIQSLEGAPLEEYATEMFRTYGIGDKEKNNGVLLLLALEDRACRIEVGYGLEGALNDAKSGRIQDNYMIPYFAEGKWDEGMRSGFDAIVAEVVKEYDVSVEFHAPVTVRTAGTDEQSISDKSNTVGMVVMGIMFAVGLLMGAIIPSFWLGILCCLAAPFIGHGMMTSYFPEMDLLMLIMSDFGVLLFHFIGFAITTKTVDTSGSSSGYSSSSYSSRSHSSSYHSSSSHSSSHSHSGGGGRSGGGGSSRRF